MSILEFVRNGDGGEDVGRDVEARAERKEKRDGVGVGEESDVSTGEATRRCWILSFTACREVPSP